MKSGTTSSNPTSTGGVTGSPLGWPTDEKIEALRAAWFAATDEAQRRDLADQIQQRAFEFARIRALQPDRAADRPACVPQEPRGCADAPLPFLWNIENPDAASTLFRRVDHDQRIAGERGRCAVRPQHGLEPRVVFGGLLVIGV